RAIARTQRHHDEQFAIVVLGLDRFKTVNNSLGPLTADRLLVAVGGRLQASLDGGAPGPRATLARLGGDEFAILLEDMTDASDAVKVAERLRAALRDPFDV